MASAGGKIVDNRKLIATQFSERNAQPSPDGARIVWAERKAGFIEEVWTGSATGENPFQLTHLNTDSGTPRWSPDGKWIAFNSGTTNGTQVFVIDTEGRNLRALTTGPYENVVASWSRDGKSIYFSSTRTGNTQIWKHSLGTGKEIQLTTHGGANPFESYDGQTVYFSKFDEAGIWRIPANGGRETLVLEGRPRVPYWGHWGLTKPGIYFVNADAEPTPRIEFFDFATRRISPVLSLEGNVPSAEPSLSATADGKTIYYALSDCSGVIKLMTIPR